MIQSVQLTPAEALLLKIEQERHEQVVHDSALRLERALKAIYFARGWEWGRLKGQMQKDPLDTNVIRFVYDDGAQPAPVVQPAAAEVAPMKIEDVALQQEAVQPVLQPA